MYVNEILPILCNRLSGGGGLERPKNQYIISSSSLQQHNGMYIFEKVQKIRISEILLIVPTSSKLLCTRKCLKMSQKCLD